MNIKAVFETLRSAVTGQTVIDYNTGRQMGSELLGALRRVE